MSNINKKAFAVGTPNLRLKVTRRLKNGIHILGCALCVAGFSQAAPAEAQAESMKQIRNRYEQACATYARTQDNGEDWREKVASGHKLLSALLNHWINLPKGSAEAPVVSQEIRTVYKDMAGSPLSELHNIEESFLVRVVWPLLATDKPTPEQARFLAELTKPQIQVRMNDKKARAGRWTEPLGWDVQAAYALALIRSGDDKQARDEISILHNKVSIDLALDPKGSLDYGPEAGAGRYRNYTDYLQLCEVLHALQAAIANDREGAKKHIENARKLREALSPEATPLVTEVDRRVKMDKD